MGERVLGPRFLALHRESCPCLGFSLIEQVALFIAEGGHAMNIRDVLVCRGNLEDDSQHFRRIAAIEFEILMHLDDGEIAGKFIGYLVADSNRALKIVVDPRPQHGCVELLAPRCQRRGPCSGDYILCRMGRGLRSLQQHPENSRVDISHARVSVRVRGPENRLRARLIRQETHDEIIDAAQRAVAAPGDLIAQIVSLHAPMIPEQLVIWPLREP